MSTSTSTSIPTSTSTTTSTSTWLCEINSIVKSLLKIYTSGEGKSPKRNSAAAKIAKKKFGAKKSFSRNFRIGKFFFANFARFRTTHGQTDGAISSRVKFCFRCAYSEVCTTKISPHPVPYRPPAHVLLGSRHMSSVGTRKCLDWNTRDVLIRTQDIS